jgi:hypothetical protein
MLLMAPGPSLLDGELEANFELTPLEPGIPAASSLARPYNR